MPEPVVSVRRMSKTFGATRALREVDLDIWPGEIHALVGQNGSGKSTLVKILAGYHSPDEGAQLTVKGEPVSLPLTPDAVDAAGLTFVHQDLGLADSLPIVDNVRVGAYATGPMWRIQWRPERSRVQRLLAEYGMEVDPGLPVGDLSVAERTIVAIVRASHTRRSGALPTVLIADEPTSYLPVEERAKLFAAFRRLTGEGVAVLFVSHRLDEIEEISDRVSVLRDGRLVGTWVTREASEREILIALVGKDLGTLYPDATSNQPGEPVIQVAGLSHPPALDTLTFDLHKGEILGLTGLMGMGHDEVPYLLYGSSRPTAGSISVDGVPIDPSPVAMLRRGVALLPGDRRRGGAIMSVSLVENVTMPVLPRYFSRGLLSHRRARSDALTLMRRFVVNPSSNPDMLMSAFSGGNQQKALLGKWLSMPDLRVLLLHEPTQGVDIGSRKLLFEFIQAAAAGGAAVLFASAEYEDLAHLCDRVIVMQGGRAVAELSGTQVTLERILERCYLRASVGTPPVELQASGHV